MTSTILEIFPLGKAAGRLSLSYTHFHIHTLSHTHTHRRWDERGKPVRRPVVSYTETAGLCLCHVCVHLCVSLCLQFIQMCMWMCAS